jgi:hypothetical protein
MSQIIENVLVKFDGFNEKGDILATPEDKSIFQKLMSQNVDFVPIVGNQLKIRLTRYNKDINPNTYIGKYARCILRTKVFRFPKQGTPEIIKSLIIYLNHMDIV